MGARRFSGDGCVDALSATRFRLTSEEDATMWRRYENERNGSDGMEQLGGERDVSPKCIAAPSRISRRLDRNDT